MRHRRQVDEQTFEITFDAPGVAGYAFTFG